MMGFADIDADPSFVSLCGHAPPSVGPRFLAWPVERPADTSVNSDRAQISISSRGTPESRANIPN